MEKTPTKEDADVTSIVRDSSRGDVWSPHSYNDMADENKTTKQKLSIDDAIEQIGMGCFQYRILIAAGLCFAADAMEVLLLSFLSVVLQAQWDLTDQQSATITSSVFLGALMGALMLGRLGDVLGRRPIFLWTAGLICVFGFATAATNTFLSLVFVRVMVGFGVGGLTVPFDILAEFVPTSFRGANLMAIEYFWTLGTLLTPVAAYFTIGNNGEEGSDVDSWRWFVIACAVPCLISTLVGFCYVPESPRWLLTKGRQHEALEVLRSAARCNGKDDLFPERIEIFNDEETEDTNISKLFSPEWRKTTILLWIVWAGFAFTYYGTIMVVTVIFANIEEDVDDQNNNGDENTLYSFDYAAIFTSASSEIAGTTIALLTIDRIGRIWTQVASFCGGGSMVLALCLLADAEQQNRTAMVITAFLARMVFMCGSCTTWVSTAEILTTEIRTTGHSASNAMARLGGSLCPFLITGTAYPVTGGVMMAMSLVTAIASSQLPETMGRALGAAGGTQVSPAKVVSAAAVPADKGEMI